MIQPNYTQFNPQYPLPSGANAVSINIINPQAYGSAPQGMQQTMAATQPSMYQMPQNMMYQMPQNMMYQMPQNMMYQMPQNMMYQQSPVMYQQMSQAPVVVPPSLQEMPKSVISQPEQPQQAEPAVVAETPKETEAKTQATEAKPEVKAEEKSSDVPQIDTNVLVAALKDKDPKVKLAAIGEIAKSTTMAPEIAYQVVSAPIMQALIDITKEDTSSLEGPSQQQLDIAEKKQKGEKLTAEETAILDTESPRDTADKNKVLAIYTLAMLQKLQRTNLNEYIEAQKANGETPIPAPKIEDLEGYNELINIINGDFMPEMKIAAIQAIQHIATPEDKATVEKILAEPLKSQVPEIKKVAEDAISMFKA